MVVDGSELEKGQVLGLTMFHCVLQGVLLATMCSALVPRPGDSIGLRAYVVAINVVALLQTVVHVVQCFCNLGEHPPHHWHEVLIPRLTPTLSASAQVFFIHRCWRIFERRWLPMIPFGALFIAAFVPGVVLGAYVYPSSPAAVGDMVRIKIHFAIWIFCSFALDLAMTGTTVLYLWRTRTGLKEHSNVFVAVWTVLWASASPPLILMFIAIIDGYMIQKATPGFIVAADITGKFFALSVMINLCGRNLVQEKFNLSTGAQARSPPSRTEGNIAVNAISVMVQQEKFIEYELKGWPSAPSTPRIGLVHERAETRSEIDTKSSGDDLDSEQVKQPESVMSEDQWLSNEQRLNHQV